MSQIKKFKFAGMRAKIEYSYPWVIVCLASVPGPDELKFPKELTIATPEMTFHYILRIPSNMVEYDVGYAYKNRKNEVRPYSTTSLTKFNETLPFHVDKARFVFAHGNIELIERIVQRPVINMHNLEGFQQIFSNSLDNCMYHTIHNTYSICTQAVAKNLTAWVYNNPRAIAFVNQKHLTVEVLEPAQECLQTTEPAEGYMYEVKEDGLHALESMDDFMLDMESKEDNVVESMEAFIQEMRSKENDLQDSMKAVGQESTDGCIQVLLRKIDSMQKGITEQAQYMEKLMQEVAEKKINGTNQQDSLDLFDLKFL